VDQIEVRSVKINDRYVNTNNYLSGTILNDGGSQNVAIGGNDFLFDSSEPALTEFTVGATQTFTINADTFRDVGSATPQIFDMLAGRDVAYLGNADDKVNGGAGNDVLYGFGGADLLYGAAGDDRIYGGAGNDTLYGGDDNDRVHGDAGDDEIHGGSGNDRLNGGADNDIITGGDGDDKLNGGTGDDYLFGDAGADQIVGGAGEDSLDGGAGDDVIYGGAGVDHINGGDDNDILVGNSGADVIHGDDGDDIMYGGDDNDELYGGIGADRIFGGDGLDTIEGGAGADIIFAGTGDDTITGGDDDDILVGGATVVVDPTNLTSYDPSQDGGGTVTQTVGGFELDSNNWKKLEVNYTVTANTVLEFNFRSTIEAEISGIGFDDDNSISNGTTFELYGTQTWGIQAFNNYDGSGDWVHYKINVGAFYTGTFQYLIFANDDDGNSPSNGTNGNSFWSGITIYESTLADDIDNVDGGDGDDYLVGNLGADILSGGTGSDNINGNDGDDTLNGGDGNDFLHGGDGDDTLDGGNNNDEIYGNGGDDIILLDGGNDIINGGAGIDVIDASARTARVTIDLSNLAAQNTRAGTDTISNIENLIGTAFNDTLAGDANNNTIEAGAGNDAIYGNGGTDLLYGEAGNDDFWISGTETYNDTYDGGADFDELQFTADTNFNSTVTILNMERMDMNGFDAYVDINDTFDFSGMVVSARGDIIGDAGTETITGSDSGDWIYGLAGNDILNGGLGADRLFGGDNDDTLNGGDGNDLLYGGDGADIMNGDIGDDDFYLSNSEGVGDTIDGGAGFNEVRLETNIFLDLTTSFTSIDRMVFGGFSVTANLGTGFDLSGMTRNGAGDLLGQGGNENITGTESADTIYGFAGVDTLNGGAGGDTIYGGNDDDTLNGGDGNDRLYGETGADIINGDAGNDDIYMGGTEPAGDTIDGGADSDDIILTSNLFLDFTTTFSNMERVVFGGFTITANVGTGFDLSGMTRNGASNLYGQGGAETITGTESDDNIYGLAGADILNGGGGNDNFYVSGVESLGDQYDGGGGGDDEIILLADSSFNSSNSFTNMEQLVFNGFNVYVTTGSTVDFSDLARSGAGIIYGDTGNETITGMTNADTIYALGGDDVVNGGNGNDIIYGGAGADTINGDAGNDNFYVSGTDALGDIYDGGAGTNYLRMEANTTFNSANSFANLTSIVNGGFDLILVSGTTIDFSGMNRNGAGRIMGDAGNETITGFDNTNVFYGLGGTDVMIGGSGNDDFYISGTEGEGDTFDGGSGGTDDEIRLLADSSFNSATTFVSIEQIVFGGFNVDIALGATVDLSGITRSGAGEIHGAAGNETITGVETGTTIRGFAGDDTIRGGANNDFIYGGADNDIIYGGDGRDELYGEGGADIFVLENATAFNDVERIRDFSAAESDALDIQDLLSGYTFGVDDLTQFVQLIDTGGNAEVYVDTAGTGTFGAGTQVATVYGVTSGEDEVALEAAGYLITH
jgi:Ca2+-binding RTX toxin-like protein